VSLIPHYYHPRLVGCPPFWNRKQMIMLRNIMEGKYSFDSPEWDCITGTKDKLPVTVHFQGLPNFL